MDQKKRTEIASLGQFGLIDLLTNRVLRQARLDDERASETTPP